MAEDIKKTVSLYDEGNNNSSPHPISIQLGEDWTIRKVRDSA